MSLFQLPPRMLRLWTFGGCWLEQDGSEPDAWGRQRKGLALLAMLSVAGVKGMSRDTVLAMLWPESDETRARSSLKQLVHTIRRQAVEPGLFLAPPDLRLNPTQLTSDIRDFRDAVRRGNYQIAIDLYAGPFLDGFFIRGGDEFERWAAAEQAWCARNYTRALEALAGGAAARGDTASALEWRRRLVAADPFNEAATIGLMTLLEETGERAAALQQARDYERIVRETYGEVAANAVTALALRLRSAAPSRMDSTRDAIRPHPLSSVAVLPFANVTGAPEDEHLTDGLTDELIVALSRLPGLRVTGRTSAFALKGKGLSVRAVADTLGVATILEGSVRRSENRLKISAQLINGEDNAVQWAETYDRELKDVFDLQVEMARAIVDALSIRFSAKAPKSSAAADMVAYEAYLKGRYLLNTRSDDAGLLLAARYFNEAIERDSKYARALAGLSDALAFRVVFGYARPHDMFPAAIAAARRAIELDSALADAHTAMAHALLVYEFDPQSAQREYQHAVALDPSSTMARFMFALCLSHIGSYDEALEHLFIAQRNDPLAAYVGAVLGRVHVNARQPDKAISVLLATQDLTPEFDLLHQQLGHAYMQKKMHDEAVAAFRRAAVLSPYRNVAHLAWALAVTGRRDDALAIIARISDPQPHALAFHLALAYTGLGEIDLTFAWLERGYEERGSFMDGLKVAPGFEPLHSDPRWTPLLRRMRLTA